MTGAPPRSTRLEPGSPLPTTWPRWAPYLLAALLSVATLMVRMEIAVSFDQRPLLVILLFPVILSAVLGGLGPGLLSTLLVALGIDYLAIPPVQSFAIQQTHDLVQLGFLILEGVLVSLLAGQFARGVTAKRTTQEALRERETITGLIFDQAGDAIELVDAETLRFVEVNDAACRMLGYTREELLSLSLVDIQADGDEARLRERGASIARSSRQIRFENRHRRKDGAILEVQINVQIARLRGRDHYVTVWRDIRAEKASQMALADEAEWRRALIENSRDGIAIFDLAHGIIEANRRFAEMQGCTPGDLLGQHPWDFNADLSEADIHRDFAAPLTVNRTFETRHRRRDGSLYEAEVSVRGARIGGRYIFVSIVRDVYKRQDRRTRHARLPRDTARCHPRPGLLQGRGWPLSRLQSGLRTLLRAEPAGHHRQDRLRARPRGAGRTPPRERP